MDDYVHGYDVREAERLHDQAAVLRDLIHDGLDYAPGTRLFEPGCGTGAQSAELLRRHPGVRLTALERSAPSVQAARRRLRDMGLTGDVREGDLLRDAPPRTFDAAFLCFVLEHLTDPVAGLQAVRESLVPGGGITVMEGDHGLCAFHPESPDALTVWRTLATCQARLGGDGLIGRRLVPLLLQAGFVDVRVEPRVVCCDATVPARVDGFVGRTILPMVAGVRDRALAAGLVDPATWDRGMADLAASAGEGGSFVYVFFRATARRPMDPA